MKNKNTTLFIGIAAVAVIAIGIIIAMGPKTKQSASTASSTGTSSSATTPDTSAAVATDKVNIKDYAFADMIVKVKVGDTVTWTNQDDVHHNIVADTDTANGPNGPLIGKGETYSFKFMKAGTYTYHCNPHQYMHGIVVVTN